MKIKERTNIKEALKKDLLSAVKKTFPQLSVEKEKIEIIIPQEIKFGDFSTNIGFILASELKKNPYEINQMLVKNLASGLIEKTQIIGGYINIFLKKEIYRKIFLETIERKHFQPLSESIVFEYGQPNTHKKPHIGHLFSYILGESLSRILEYIGFKVIRVNYQGDVGPHIAKCLLGILQRYEKFKKLAEIKKDTPKTLKEKIEFLQECYVLGNKLVEESKEYEEKFRELNKKIYQKDKEVKELYEITRNWSLKFYKWFESILGSKFQRYYFESETFKIGEQIVKKNLGTVFQESKGAIIFPGEKYGLHNRVFINSQGLPTYEAKDIGLVKLKLDEYSPDYLIITTAKEQAEYFKVIIKVAETLFPQIQGRFLHIPFGMVNLAQGKMSSRKGTIIGGLELIEDVKKLILKTYDVEETTAEKIAISAVKYAFLNSEREKDFFFDPEKSIAKEGSSGPYLLYSYVRAKSILQKSQKTEEELKKLEIEHSLILESENLFLRRLFYFKESIISSFQKWSPHVLEKYLFELSQEFNHIYQKLPILTEENEKIRKTRISYTFLYKKTMELGLSLLGIPLVEKI